MNDSQKRSVTIFAKATAQLPEDRSRLFVRYSTIAARAASLITFSLNQGDIPAFISQVIRQRSAHDAGTNDNDSFVQSISHINLHSVDLKAVSVSASGRFLLVVTGSRCRPESRCRFV